MSVEVEVFLIDWDDFNKKIARDGESAAIEELHPEPLVWTSWKAAGEFVQVFEAMERTWRSPGKQRFATILDALFWSWRGKDQIMELGIESSSLNGIESSLSPATVRRLVSLADGIDLGECEGQYVKAAAKAGVDRFETFADYRRYAEGWFGVLRRAAETERGVMIVAFA